MKKTLFILAAVIFFSGSFYGQGQERIFKFIQSGTNADINYTAVDSLGNLYIAGTFRNSFTYDGLTISGNPNGDAYDSYLLKVFPNGKAVYLKSIVSGLAENSAAVRAMDVNNKGEVAVVISAPGVNSLKVGDRTIALSVNDADQVIAKISRNGFLMWARRIRAIGGTTNISAEDIKMDTTGNIYITGNFSGTTAYFGTNTLDGFSNGYSKLFVAKYTIDGTEEWASTCDVTSDTPTDTTGSIFAYHLEIGTGNRLYISGDYDGTRRFVFGTSSVKNIGISNAYMACYFVTGDFAWIKEYKGVGTVRAGDMEIDSLNNIISTCFFKADSFQANSNVYTSINSYQMLISKYQANGTFIWEYLLNTDLSYVGAINEDSKIFVGDSSHLLISGNLNNLGIDRFYVVKLNGQTGNTMFLLACQSSGSASYYSITSDRRGDLYIAGIAYSPFVFNGYTVSTPTAYGTSYLIKMSNEGDHVYGYQKENTLDQTVYFESVEVDYYKNIMLSGTYNGKVVNLDKNDVTMLDNSGIFIARYTPVASIEGKVVNMSGSSISGGYVKLLGYAKYQKCPVSDSVPIGPDGSYIFSNVPLGMYLLYAFPGTTGGLDYLPSFYVSSGHWEDAERLRVEDKLTYSGVEILVPQKFELLGDGRIAGNLTEVDEGDIFKSITNKPRARSKATLAKSKLKSDYDIVAVVVTDDYGDFYFNNVENGDYLIFIEEPGLPNISTHQVTISGNSYYSNVDYYMNEDNIEAVGNPELSALSESAVEDDISIYPNPSTGLVIIASAGNIPMLSCKVLSLDGKTLIKESALQNEEPIELNLQPGVYIIQVNTQTKTLNKKLIVRN